LTTHALRLCRYYVHALREINATSAVVGEIPASIPLDGDIAIKRDISRS
jgi:hypothetical protein